MESYDKDNIKNLQKRKPAQTLKEAVIRNEKNKLKYRLGIMGEEFTAKVLNELGENYKVLHSIPISLHKKDIDHIVIGPSGIFIINSKNYRAKSLLIDDEFIIYNKKRLSDPIDLQRDVRYVESLFKVKNVVPIISLVNNNSLRIKSSKISKVIHAYKIPNFIKSQEKIYDEHKVDKIYSEMSNYKIWGINNLKDPDTVEQTYISKKNKSEKNVDLVINEKALGITLAFFTGVLGIHRLYYKKYNLFFINLVLILLSFSMNFLFFYIYIWSIFDITLIIRGIYYKK